MDMIQTTEELEAKMREDFAKIGVSLDNLKQQNRISFSENLSYSLSPRHVFVEDGVIHLIEFGERGVEDDLRTSDLDVVLYRIYSDEISYMASRYAAKNAHKGEDWRHSYFEKELEWFRMIDEKYYLKAKATIDEALKNNPYNY